MQLQRDAGCARRIVLDDHELQRPFRRAQRAHHDVRLLRRRDAGAQRPIAGEHARQQQRVPLRLGLQRSACETRGRGGADGRVAAAIGGGALQVDAHRACAHRLGDVTDRPQRRGERVADAGPPAAGDRVGLIHAEARVARPRDREVARKRGALERADTLAEKRFDRRRGHRVAAQRVVVAGQERRALAARLGCAPAHERPRSGDAGTGQRDRRGAPRDCAAVGADLGLIGRGCPGQPAQLMAPIGVGLVADLDSREQAAENAARRDGLARGGEGVVVSQAERQQHPPAALSCEPAQAVQVRGDKHAARPCRARRVRIAPRDACVRRGASEA